jgi:predicted alpha/beta-fold hydrolase
MALDGATLALDWEMTAKQQREVLSKKTHKNPKEYVLKGPIVQPVILILHGINNDSNAAYIRALQRTMTDRGYVAVGMNFRGCGGVPLSTPRGYNGAFTGDLRCVVQSIQARLAPNVPIFLVGHSLGANLVAKYLGEEGLSGTLPLCVAGGACLGNPLEIHSKNNMHTPWKQLLAWGVKLDMALQWRTLRKTLMYPEFRRAYWKTLKASHIHEIDEALCPVTLRNDPYYPFAARIGYRNGEEYWDDASSYRFIKHISVPLFKIIAGDDKVVYHSFQRKLTHNILNPNIMSVETKCGGHLGWQESPPRDSNTSGSSILGGVGPSWAGRATADFIDAVMQTRRQGTTVSSFTTASDTTMLSTSASMHYAKATSHKERPHRNDKATGINGAKPRNFIPIIPSRL